MTGRIASLGSTLLLALVVAAASSAPSQAAVAPTTRADYVARAEPICKAGQATIAPLLKGLGKDLERSRLSPAGQALSRAARIFDRQRGRLTAIPRPAADAATLTTWLKQLRVQQTLMATAGGLLREGRKAKVQGYLTRYAHAGSVANDTVLGFGFDQCLFRLAKLPSPKK